MFHLDFFRFHVIVNFSRIPIGVRSGSHSVLITFHSILITWYFEEFSSVLVCLMTLLFDCTSYSISLGLRSQ